MRCAGCTWIIISLVNLIFYAEWQKFMPNNQAQGRWLIARHFREYSKTPRQKKSAGHLTGPLTCSRAATQRSEHSLYRPCWKSSFTSSRKLRHSSFPYGRKVDCVALTRNIFLGDVKDGVDVELEQFVTGMAGAFNGAGVVWAIG